MTPIDGYLTRAEVAHLFSVSPSTITRWAEEGKLAHVRTLGGHRRYATQDILELVRTLSKEKRMEIMTTEIPRMYGDHHVSAVLGALSDMAGIHDLTARAATRTLTVVFDPEATSADAIFMRLAERGYPPRNGHAPAEGGSRKDPAWARSEVRMTQTHPADR